MKIEANTLKSAMKIAASIIEPRNSIPVLGTVKIERGRMIATNLDMEASIALPSISDAGDPFCIGLHQALRLLSHVPGDEEITIAAEEAKHPAQGKRSAYVTAGVAMSFNGSRYSMTTSPAADFPAFPPAPAEMAVTETGNMSLAAAIRAVRFCVPTEETRYYLNGVCISKDADGAPVAVATDGHRLAWHPIGGEVTGATGAIIPFKLAGLIAAWKSEPERVAINHEAARARFELPGARINGKLINGTFPDWKRVLPTSNEPWFAVKPETILPALRRLVAFSPERGRAVKIEVAPGRAVLTMTRQGESEAREEIAVSAAVTREPFAMNANYLLDAISALKGCDALTIEGKGPHEPFLIHGDRSSLRIVQMPMRSEP